MERPFRRPPEHMLNWATILPTRISGIPGNRGASDHPSLASLGHLDQWRFMGSSDDWHSDRVHLTLPVFLSLSCHHVSPHTRLLRQHPKSSSTECHLRWMSESSRYRTRVTGAGFVFSGRRVSCEQFSRSVHSYIGSCQRIYDSSIPSRRTSPSPHHLFFGIQHPTIFPHSYRSFCHPRPLVFPSTGVPTFAPHSCDA